MGAGLHIVPIGHVCVLHLLFISTHLDPALPVSALMFHMIETSSVATKLRDRDTHCNYSKVILAHAMPTAMIHVGKKTKIYYTSQHTRLFAEKALGMILITALLMGTTICSMLDNTLYLVVRSCENRAASCVFEALLQK